MERTFMMVKPDGVQRGLIGKIIARLEDRGMKIVAMKLTRLTKKQAEEQYAEHKGQDFYEPLLKYMMSGPVLVMVVEGDEAIDQIRKMTGNTDPAKAEPGTIRFDFAQDIKMNTVHASDKKKSAEREMRIYFSDDEILEYNLDVYKWMFRD